MSTYKMFTKKTNILKKGFIMAIGAIALSMNTVTAAAFDHQHEAWTGLLNQHIKVIDGGKASQVDYKAFKKDHMKLKSYLANLTAVSGTEFSEFSKLQQKAFLINAYNAYTVELILTRYPKLKSINDLGTLFKNPWKQEFVPLLGDMISLDDIEHGKLRQAGKYDDPRIHFAVNCASIGCPPLREEAFIASSLDEQLNEQAVRFLSDRSRNNFDEEANELNVSKIFKWYGDDFEKGHLGIDSLEDFFAGYAEYLADSKSGQEKIKTKKVDIEFLKYDWNLNDTK